MRMQSSFSSFCISPLHSCSAKILFNCSFLFFLMSSPRSSKNHLAHFPTSIRKTTADQGASQYLGVFSQIFTLLVSKDWERDIYHLFLNSAYTWMELHFLFDCMFYFLLTFPPSQQLKKLKEKVELLMWSKNSVASVGKRHTFIYSRLRRKVNLMKWFTK